MCGRVNVYDHSGIQSLLEQLGVPIWPQVKPRYNIAPTQNLDGLIRTKDGIQHEQFVWGFVPPWAKPGQFKSPLINARSETIYEKASFKNLIKRQRTVLPVNGFYEWQRSGGQKKPYYIFPAQDEVFFIAGIYQHIAENQSACCLITTSANARMQQIHSRMPAIIQAEDIESWLHDDSTECVESLMQPSDPDFLDQYEVSSYVNNARNEGEQCMRRVHQ